MFTLYAPVAGQVSALPGEPGLAIEVSGAAVIVAPTRGRLDRLDDAGFEITDARSRRIAVRLMGDPGAMVPLAAAGDALAFDQPILRWEPAGDPALRVEVVSLGVTEVLNHAEPGSAVAVGADLFSVGPFSCGA